MMLKLMRRHATGWMIKIMFSLIIIVFVFWGVGTFKEREKTVAEVGSVKVGISEYGEAYKRLYDRYRMLYADRFDENVLNALKLKEKALDQIVDKYLFLQKAKELRLGVSDREFSEYLQSIDAFKRNGRFDQKVYEEILKREGMDPKHFEKNERDSIIVAKLMTVLQDNGFSPNDQEMEKSYMRDRGVVKLGYQVFDPGVLGDAVSVDEKQIADAYEREKMLHKTENRYHLRYMVIDGKSHVKDDQAYMELLKSKDIQAYGKAKGLEVVDLGAMKESEILSRLARFKPGEWLKGMNKGDISLPIRDDGKSCIFQVVNYEEGKVLDRQDAYRVIKARLVSERAKLVARTRAESSLADKSIRFSKDTGFLPRSSTSIPSIGTVPMEHAGVFALSVDKKVYGKPVEISGKYYVFGYEDEKAPDKAQYEREKQAYRQYYLGKAREEFLASLREELKKKIKVKVDYQAL